MPTLLFENVTIFSNKHRLLPENTTIIVGISGGPDSVFLLHYLHWLRPQKNLTLVAAHLDHGWRADSFQDSLFCQELCTSLEIPLVVTHLSDLAIAPKNNGSQEEQGRRARRLFFEHVCQTHNGNAIALAHHADDQQETFFIRLLRGASLPGLTGIKAHHGLYIRPLLHTPKQEILTWLEQHAIPYLIDPTNTSPRYLRNRIRATVIPALRASDVRFDDTFARTLEQLQATEDFLQTLTLETFQHLVGNYQTLSGLNLEKFLHVHPIMQQRILLYWLIQTKVKHTPTQHFFAELLRFIKHPGNGVHSITPGWNLQKTKGLLTLQPSIDSL